MSNKLIENICVTCGTEFNMKGLGNSKALFKNRSNLVFAFYSFLSSSPQSDNKLFTKIFSGFIVIYNTVLVLFCIYYLEEINDEIIMSLFFTVNMGVVVLKNFNLYFGSGKIKKLVDHFETTLDQCSLTDSLISERILKLTKKSYAFSWVLLVCYGFSAIFIIAMAVYGTIMSRKIVLPMPHSKLITSQFYLEFILQSIGFLFLCLASYTFDNFYIYSSNFIQAHLDALIMEMGVIKPEITINGDKRMSEKLVQICKRHISIIKSNQLLNEAFDFTLFVQMSVSTIAICFGMVQQKNSFVQVVIPSQVLEISIFCYFGQKLEDQSFELEKAVYALPWVEMTVKNRKFLLLMFRQAQRKLISTAGPFNNLSYDTLKNIFQAAYSFYAVLKTD